MDNKTQKQNEGKAIVLNRMYAGNYLSTNLGHEVINMFKADNNKHYLYLNAYGNLSKVHFGKIAYMLLVKYHSKGMIEVIGKAEGLEEVPGAYVTRNKDYKCNNDRVSEVQRKFIEKEDIKYDEAALLKIFNNAEQQNIFITYLASGVYKPKVNENGRRMRIFIRYDKTAKPDVTKTLDQLIISLKGYNQANTPLKVYVYPEGTYKGDQTLSKVDDKEDVIEKRKDDYGLIIKELIENKDIWEKEPVQDVKKELEKDWETLNLGREVSLFDICQIQYDENRFSNAIEYFIKQYPDLWIDFFQNGKCHEYERDGEGISKESFPIGVSLDKETLSVKREQDTTIGKSKQGEAGNKGKNSGRIDLFISDAKNILVIENKIKSDINKTQAESTGTSTQLDRYVDYVHYLNPKTDNNKPLDEYYFILAPNYNIPEIDKSLRCMYKVITYKNLYEFLDGRNELENDDNLKAFFDAMYRHTHENINDVLYYDMLEKFVRRINEVNNKKRK